MGIWYATEEQICRSLEIMHTAKASALIRRKLEASSRAVEGQLLRRFYPERRTVRIDYPNYQYAPAWQLWLDSMNEIISIETLSSGGTSIAADDRMLRRADDLREPPYQWIEIDTSSNAAFTSGDTWQEAIEVVGLFGSTQDTDTSYVDGELEGAINTSVTSITLIPSSGSYEVGVGSIILMESERMVVRDRRMADTTINTTTTLDDMQNAETLGVGSGSAFAIGETILVNSERMYIHDIAGNNLIVERAYDGTTLAEHASGQDVYARRTFIVQRGALGSTAASHSDAVTFSVHRFPGLVNELCEAECLNMIEQAASGWARVIGGGENARETGGQGLNDIRAQACQLYGSNVRHGAI